MVLRLLIAVLGAFLVAPTPVRAPRLQHPLPPRPTHLPLVAVRALPLVLMAAAVKTSKMQLVILRVPMAAAAGKFDKSTCLGNP